MSDSDLEDLLNTLDEGDLAIDDEVEHNHKDPKEFNDHEHDSHPVSNPEQASSEEKLKKELEEMKLKMKQMEEMLSQQHPAVQQPIRGCLSPPPAKTPSTPSLASMFSGVLADPSPSRAGSALSVTQAAVSIENKSEATSRTGKPGTVGSSQPTRTPGASQNVSLSSIFGDALSQPAPTPKRKPVNLTGVTMTPNTSGAGNSSSSGGDKCPHSGIRICDRSVSKSDFNCTIATRKYFKISVLATLFKDGTDIEGNWITSGVIVRKSGPYRSSTGNDYSIWTVSDLQSINGTISVFLFKGTHLEHRKETVGTVVALLNANFMPPRDKERGKKTDLAFSIDNPKKVIRLGLASDFGTCRHVFPKTGEKCNNFINKALTQYCEFHLLKVHAKMRNKRIALSGVFTPQPNIKKPEAQACQAFVHKGKAYYPNLAQSATTSTGKKPESKAEQSAASLACKKKGMVISTPLVSHEEFKKRLNVQSAGSIQLKRSLESKKEEKENDVQMKRARVETADGFFKKHIKKPQLGSGLSSGTIVDLNVCPKKAAAKAAAIKLARQMGGFQKQDPNGRRRPFTEAEKQKIMERTLGIEEVSKEQTVVLNGPSDMFYDSPKLAKTTKSSLKTTNKPSKTSERSHQKQPDQAKSRGILSGVLDMVSADSEEGKRILKAKPLNDTHLKNQELERMVNYFDALEKFEYNEERLQNVTEMKITLYICDRCRTATRKLLDECRTGNHLVRKSPVLKKFFRCVACKTKVDVVGLPFPDKPCQKCGKATWERCSMYHERKGPKLESEKLVVRGEEVEKKAKFGFVKED